MKEHKLSGELARIIFESVEEQLGKNGLNMLLRKAGFEQYIDNLPPNDDTPTLEMSKLKYAIRSIVELFGEKTAKPLFLRWGTLVFQYSFSSLTL